jgi:hypothetical protein
MLVSSLAVVFAMLVMASGANAQAPAGEPLFAVLNGGNECDGAVVCRKGDLDAIGSATILIPTPLTSPNTRVCWAITADNLAQIPTTAAHIHRGTAGLNGGVVVTLTPPNAPAAGNPGTSSGCTNAPTAIINQIRLDPTSFYVNVHNGNFPNGAIRGQLH